MNKQGTFKVLTMLLYDRQLGFYRSRPIYYNNALRNYEEKQLRPILDIVINIQQNKIK